MPRSAIIYTDQDGLAAIRRLGQRVFDTLATKPFTLSPAQKTEEQGKVRVRVTEMKDDAFLPIIRQEVERGSTAYASSSDRDVRRVTYEDLLEDASPAALVATIQFVSPVIVETLPGRATPFPVLSSILQRYTALWNTFSGIPISWGDEIISAARVTDFGLSCRTTPFGAGGQGWVKIEMVKGRTEEEIRAFNALVDFSFYAGTGLHTDEGLGQTRRMETKRVTAE